MIFRRLEYAISEATMAVKQNFLMSVASALTSALTLTLLALTVLMALGLHNGVADFLNQSEIAVFVRNGVNLRAVREIKSEISKIQNVKSIKYIPADEAWKEMKAKLEGKVELSGINTNPLPDSFRVKLVNPAYTEKTAKKIESINGIDEVVRSQEYVDQALKLINIIKVLGAIGIALFFAFTAFIISNTIRLTVYARRNEIKIMQMVGASNWFIRLPLVIEGSTLGIIGGGIACLLTYVISYYVGSWTTHIMPLLGKLSSNIDRNTLYLSIVILGWFMGLVGTMISIQKYLKYEKL